MSEIVDDMFDEAMRFEAEEAHKKEYQKHYQAECITELEAALAERDKRIAELEALVEKMKCCQNCDVYNKDVTDIPFPCQVCVKHNKWRMK